MSAGADGGPTFRKGIVMPRILSKIATDVAYPGAVKGSKVRVKSNAETPVSEEDAEAVYNDPNFKRHMDAGLVAITNDEPPANDPPVPAEPDPRARKARESEKAWKARLAKLDEEAADASALAAKDAEFLAAYNDLGDEEKAAMYATLNAHEKALVDGQPKA